MVALSPPARRDGNGFSAEVAGAQARRQLRLSLGMVAVLALGIVSAAVTVGPHPMEARRDVGSDRPVVTMHAEADPVGAEAI